MLMVGEVEIITSDDGDLFVVSSPLLCFFRQQLRRASEHSLVHLLVTWTARLPAAETSIVDVN